MSKPVENLRVIYNTQSIDVIPISRLSRIGFKVVQFSEGALSTISKWENVGGEIVYMGGAFASTFHIDFSKSFINPMWLDNGRKQRPEEVLQEIHGAQKIVNGFLRGDIPASSKLNTYQFWMKKFKGTDRERSKAFALLAHQEVLKASYEGKIPPKRGA